MGDNVKSGIWNGILGSIGMIGMAGAAIYMMIGKDRKAYRELVRDKGITDPREVWDAALEYNKKTRKELAEANATIEAAKEVCEIGDGLVAVRKMMVDLDPPKEVKQAIISHWWSKLMRLFVPWGIVMPEEIDTGAHQNLYFSLASMVDPSAREAALRMYVYKYKEGYESWKSLYEDTFSVLTSEERATIFERRLIDGDKDEKLGKKATEWADLPWLGWSSKEEKDDAKTHVKEWRRSASSRVKHPMDQLACSFCGKDQTEVKKLIAGPGVHICNECVNLCGDIIAESQIEDMDDDELTKVGSALAESFIASRTNQESTTEEMADSDTDVENAEADDD